MIVIDFTEAPTGLLVKRSAHQRQQHCRPSDAPDEFGILTGKTFFDESGMAVCYPLVFWEGQPAETLCHPINVEPVRAHTLPSVQLPHPLP